MSTLIDALAAKLPADSLHLRTPVSRLSLAQKSWHVALADGSSTQVDGVILACPSGVSAQLLRDVQASMADELGAIQYASSGTMILAYRRDQIAHALDGFGFVVPTIEKRSILSATFSSVKFAGRAPDRWVSLRAFFGGAVQPEMYERSDAELKQAVERDLHDLIGVQGSPAWVEIFRWPRSMPQYHVGHLQRVQRINGLLDGYPTLAVAGNAFGGVGMPDCIHSAELAADRLLAGLNSH
jgi:oxygen-dependent protoporphyrinogen oxidase